MDQDHGLVTAQEWSVRRFAFHPDKKDVLIWLTGDVYNLYDHESDTKQGRLGVCEKKD